LRHEVLVVRPRLHAIRATLTVDLPINRICLPATGFRTSGSICSWQLLKAGAGQKIIGGDVGGIYPCQLDQNGAGDLRSDQRTLLREESSTDRPA
jgi:hypothetical protein